MKLVHLKKVKNFLIASYNFFDLSYIYFIFNQKDFYLIIFFFINIKKLNL